RRSQWALGLLAGAMGTRPAPEAAPVAGTDSPLLLAVMEVGRALGVPIAPHPDTLKGVPSRDPVEAIAKASQIRTRRVVLREGWWREDAGPLLGFVEDGGHPVALLPAKRGTYEAFDPRTGQRTRVDAALAATLNGFGYVFYR